MQKFVYEKTILSLVARADNLRHGRVEFLLFGLYLFGNLSSIQCYRVKQGLADKIGNEIVQWYSTSSIIFHALFCRLLTCL